MTCSTIFHTIHPYHCHNSHPARIINSVIPPWFIAVGDFDGDGNLDLVVGHPYGTTNTGIGLLFGNGDGTFWPGPVFSGVCDTLLVADFNGDGRLDIAGTRSIEGYTAGTLSIFLGNGDGTFQASANYDFPSFVRDLALGDFNGDGIVDIATDFGAILLGNGDGTFQNAKQSYLTGDAYGLAVGGTTRDPRRRSCRGKEIGDEPGTSREYQRPAPAARRICSFYGWCDKVGVSARISRTCVNAGAKRKPSRRWRAACWG